MSCYLVSKSHIDALVALYATDRKRLGPPLTAWEMDAMGRMLIRANVQSIESRYPDTVGKPDEMPGPNSDNPERAFADAYTWRPVTTPINPIAAIALVRCYEYQTCEFDGFTDSDAGLFCQYLTARLIERFFPGHTMKSVCDLPEFTSAPWGL